MEQKRESEKKHFFIKRRGNSTNLKDEERRNEHYQEGKEEAGEVGGKYLRFLCISAAPRILLNKTSS